MNLHQCPYKDEKPGSLIRFRMVRIQPVKSFLDEAPLTNLEPDLIAEYEVSYAGTYQSSDPVMVAVWIEGSGYEQPSPQKGNPVGRGR